MSLYVEPRAGPYGLVVWDLGDNDFTDAPVISNRCCDAIDIICVAANRAWERGAPLVQDKWFNDIRMHHRPDMDYANGLPC